MSPGAPRNWRRVGPAPRLAFLVRLAPALLLLLHHLATAATRKDNLAPACSNETQFTCSINNICIPIEWRCDFTEHCADGEDEFGCPTEWCDFGRDLCNWLSRPQAVGQANSGLWRRHSRAARNQQVSPAQRPSKERLEVEARLDRLRDKLEPASGFVYAPITLSPGFPSSADRWWPRNTTSGLATRRRFEARSGNLLTPYLGRTPSNCQLKFRYALWAVAPAGAGLEAARLSLKLIERQPGKPSRLVWRRTVDTSSASWNASHDAVDWLVGLAELGRSERSRLFFQVSLVLRVAASEAANLSLLEEARREQGQPRLRLVALAALTQLHFRSCAWPQTFNANQLLEQPSASLDDEWEQAGPAGEPPQCLADELKCASSGLCVPSYRLCNFVDDCMATSGPVEDEAMGLCKGVPGMQDFEAPRLQAQHLSGPAPSGETNQSAEQKLTLKEEEEEEEQFWSLASNWPAQSISVRNSIRGAGHLPLRDHTLLSARGHYLSFELGAPASQPPLASSNNASNDNNIFWIYLDSPLMRKRGADNGSAAAECRLKLFYNIVADSQQQQQQLGAPFAHRIYLAIEHFVLHPNESAVLSRQLDMFTHSKLLEFESSRLTRSDGFIESPGVDFWREINYKLRNLNEGDLFYLRLALIVEPDRRAAGRASLNLDDLATHFGCAQVRQAGRNPLANTTGRHFNLSSYFAGASGPAAAAASGGQLGALANNRRLRLKQGALGTPVQFEPQKLIMYVLLVLAGIIGLVLLIVFVTVPYVEQFTINYHDQLNADLSAAGPEGVSGAAMLDRHAAAHIRHLRASGQLRPAAAPLTMSADC